MRFRALLSATLFLFCITTAAWSAPLPILAVSGTQPAPDNQSLSGPITAVSETQFSVQVAKNKDASIVQFMIDGKTKVEGKLAVGAQATVEYRTEEGKNIAVRVIVTPTSGMNSY